MELMILKCPQCMGEVFPYGDGSHGRCECCDSVFSLNAAAAGNADDAGGANDDEGTIDLEGLFDDFARELDEDDSYEFLIGCDLESPKGQSKIQAATKYFEIEDDEDVYLVLDTTMFGSCKVGFACCTYGIYMKDDDGDMAFLNWEDYADCELERDGGTITIGGHPFISTPDSAKALYPMLRKLQRELR